MQEQNITSGTEERIRFFKPQLLLDKVNRDPNDSIIEAFLIFHLDDISQEIDQWLQIALINENSAYEEGEAREDLMDFCAELQLLVEAFHVMNEFNKPKNADDWKKKLPDDLREEIEQLDQPELLSLEQTANPMLVLKDFCSTYTISYSRAELWDLLDAVITYDGEKEICKTSLLLAFQCISCLVEAAYILNNNNSSSRID